MARVTVTDARRALNKSPKRVGAVRLWVTTHVFSYYNSPYTVTFEQFPDRTILVTIASPGGYSLQQALLKPIKDTQAFQIYGSQDYFDRVPAWVKTEIPVLTAKFVEAMPASTKELEMWDD